MIEIEPIEIGPLGGDCQPIAPPAAPPVQDMSPRARRVAEREKRRLARMERARRRQERQYVGVVPSTEKMPKIFITREGEKVPIANHWYGAHLFVVLGGPSLKTLPLLRLQERGVVTMAINNAAMVVRPNLWTYVDPVEKFHSTIWNDPAIIKLIPHRHFGERMRIRHPDGRFEVTKVQVGNLPNVLGYTRGANFNPATYLDEGEINFGNSKRNLSNGQPHIINVFFTVFKLAYYLGFRTVNLLGCDFRMEYGQSYAFNERKDPGACDSNNKKYGILADCMRKLLPYFDKAGLKVYNCNQDSGLKVFPFRSFSDALTEATLGTRDMETAGWYTKQKP